MSQPTNLSAPQPSKQPASSRQTLEGDNTGNIIGNIHAGGDVYINTSLPKTSPQPVPPKLPANAKIFISYKRGVTPDETLALELYDALKIQLEILRIFFRQRSSFTLIFLQQTINLSS